MAKLPDGRNYVLVTANKTLTAADQGTVQRVGADGVVITLPSTAAGLVFTIQNGGAAPTGTPVGAAGDASVGLTIAPQAADGVTGFGVTTPAVNKGLTVTKANSLVGDEVTLEASGTAGVGAWNVTKSFGSGWTRVA